MILPIRCFTCGKLIAHQWEEYEKCVSMGEDPARVLDDMGFRRFCCRRMILTHVDLTEMIVGNNHNRSRDSEEAPQATEEE